MHDGNPHSHSHSQGHSHSHSHTHHNSQGVAQWQTPHLPDQQEAAVSDEVKDLDLVEVAFFVGFAKAEDPVSFLRLSGIPLKGLRDGKSLSLLRVEQVEKCDLSTLTPHLGGESYSCDPLPARLVTKRKVNEFIYFDGERPLALEFNEARAMEKVD